MWVTAFASAADSSSARSRKQTAHSAPKNVKVSKRKREQEKTGNLTNVVSARRGYLVKNH
eukprot:6497384-Karenia_brevis.AAC.1